MRLKILVLAALFFSVNIFGQFQGINYKALIKDGGGNVVSNQNITVEFEIIMSGGSWLTVYRESHTPTTDANGIIIVYIGEGHSTSWHL